MNALLVLHRIRETLRTLFLMTAARLLGYNGAEFGGGYEGVHPHAKLVETIGSINWCSDEFGAYWHAPLLRDGAQIGTVGTYYDLVDVHKRASRADQERDILARMNLR